MSKVCKRHSQPVTMLPAVIDFHMHKVKVGYYCMKCHNFIPVQNPEIEFYKNLLQSELQV